MDVAFDANATANAFANGATTVTNSNLTVGSGSNRALVAQFTDGVGTSISGLSMTWDSGGTNQALAAIPNASVTDSHVLSVRLWGLVAPTSGNKSLVASWTTATNVYLNAVSWTGVNQTGGATSFPNGTTATGTGTTAQGVTVTSATGNAVMAVHATSGAGNVNSVSGTQTFIDNSQVYQAGGNRDVGAASVAMTATYSASTDWVSAGTDIAAAASTAPNLPRTPDGAEILRPFNMGNIRR